MSQNIKPSVWGPPGWRFMHYVSLGYPDNPSEADKENYKRFYESLQYVLPCHTCAENYKKNWQGTPIDGALESRDTLTKWVIDIHNKVNIETGKKELGYQAALDLYLKQTSPLLEYGFKICVLLVVLAVIYYFMNHYSF
jgi:hypothetical protein